MEIGIFTKTFAGNSLDIVFHKMQTQGIQVGHFNFSCVGLSALPQHISDETVFNIQKSAAAHNIQLPSISATFNMISPDEREVETGIRAFSEIARIAPLLGAKTITLCTGSRNISDKWREHPDNETPQAWRDMLTVFERLLTVAEKHDLWLGVEPEAANVVANAAKARQLIDNLQSDRIKILLDPANLFESGTSDSVRPILAKAIDLLHPYLVMVHAKDRKADGTFCAAGKGVVDFDFFIKKLHDSNFDGTIILHGLEETEVPEAVHFLQTKRTN